MKRKPLEKLSDRLEKLFMQCARGYGRNMQDISSRMKIKTSAEFGKKASEYVMDMIAEYEPEDIE